MFKNRKKSVRRSYKSGRSKHTYKSGRSKHTYKRGRSMKSKRRRRNKKGGSGRPPTITKKGSTAGKAPRRRAHANRYEERFRRLYSLQRERQPTRNDVHGNTQRPGRPANNATAPGLFGAASERFHAQALAERERLQRLVADAEAEQRLVADAEAEQQQVAAGAAGAAGAAEAQGSDSDSGSDSGDDVGVNIII